MSKIISSDSSQFLSSVTNQFYSELLEPTFVVGY